MNLDIQPLCDLIYIQSGFAFKSQLFNQDNGLPLIRIRNVTSGNIDTFYSGDYKREYIVENGDLLVSMDGEFRLAKWNKGKALLNQRVCKLTVTDEKLLEDYLFYYLPKKLKNIEDKTPFVTVKHLSVKDINKIRIPLPPLSIQKKIVRVLDKARELIDFREEQIRLLDELVQSVFYDMFGDPVGNPKGWEVSPLKNFSAVKIGPFGSLLHAEDYISGGIPLINPIHIKDFKISPDEDFTITKEKLLELEQYKLELGDIVLGRRGEMGRCGIVEEKHGDLLCGTGSMYIRLHSRVIPEYLRFVITSPSYKKYIEDNAVGVTMKNLNSKIVNAFVVPLPPIKLQKEFTAKVQKIEAQKSLMQQSLEEMKNNYNSLMQRAFKGELFG